MFDDLVRIYSNQEKDQQKLGSNSFRSGSDFYFGHPDPDPSDYTEALPKAMLSTLLIAPPPLHPAASTCTCESGSSSRWLA